MSASADCYCFQQNISSLPAFIIDIRMLDNGDYALMNMPYSSAGKPWSAMAEGLA